MSGASLPGTWQPTIVKPTAPVCWLCRGTTEDLQPCHWCGRMCCPRCRATLEWGGDPTRPVPVCDRCCDEEGA